MIKPISPSEIGKAKEAYLPPKIVECWNRVIAKHFSNGSSKVPQKEILDEFRKHMRVTPSAAIKRGWLDVEDLYAEYGWEVTYDKPGYNESYDAVFEFKEVT